MKKCATDGEVSVTVRASPSRWVQRLGLVTRAKRSACALFVLADSDWKDATSRCARQHRKFHLSFAEHRVVF